MKIKNETDLFLKNMKVMNFIIRKKSNLNISFNRIAFIFFVFLILSIIFQSKAFHLGSNKKKKSKKNLINQKIRSGDY